MTAAAARILVLNPNSTRHVTDGIDRALEPLRGPGQPEIVCRTLTEGPPGIQSQRDVDDVAPLVARAFATDNESAAFVIACFSDPGLHGAREATQRPVFGIMECGLTTAMNLGQRVGVIAVMGRSIPRHARAFRAMGLQDRVAGEIPVDLPVVELADEGKTRARMLAVGRELKERHSADVLVMGCAGMAQYRAPLEELTGLPVVDPTQAAVAMAIGCVKLGLGGR
jgi:Asp/Glu/hydantoin racemase